MYVKINNFKTFSSIEFNLLSLNLVIGPPASGKSNLLDAISLAGYFNRLKYLFSEYNNSIENIEPLPLILRFGSIEHLFHYHDLNKKIKIQVKNNDIDTSVSIYFEKGKNIVELNGIKIPWRSLEKLDWMSVSSLEQVIKPKQNTPLVEARLYGYDRYGLSSPSCQSANLCGFNNYIKGENAIDAPKRILSELGWNSLYLTKSIPDIIMDINNTFIEDLGEKIEIKVLRNGSIVIFDYNQEVDSIAVSDSIFRTLYYLMAIKTSINYIKYYGLENRFILMLEEPEAHLFPFFIDLLVKYLEELLPLAHVIITTHNPLLVSKLWDRIKEMKTYYTLRDNYGRTNLYEISIDKLADDLAGSDDLLLLSPKEIIKKYSIENK